MEFSRRGFLKAMAALGASSVVSLPTIKTVDKSPAAVVADGLREQLFYRTDMQVYQVLWSYGSIQHGVQYDYTQLFYLKPDSVAVAAHRKVAAANIERAMRKDGL